MPLPSLSPSADPSFQVATAGPSLREIVRDARGPRFPSASPRVRLADRNGEAVERALGWIRAHVSSRQPLAQLSDFLGVSPATVQRMFRKQLGTTVMKSVAETRLREAARMLVHDGASIKEVAYHLGYRHPHDFSRAFRKNTGMLPSRWEASIEGGAVSRGRGANRAARVATHF